MKQQKLRFKMLALLLMGLFVLLAVYGGYSINAYGNRWFSFSRNPRIRAQKENVIAGDVLDRCGVLLASTVDGQRVYQPEKASRMAVVHVLGDPQGQVSNGVETFQALYLYGFQSSPGELLLALGNDLPRKGDNVTLTIDSRLCTQIAQSFESHPLSAGKNGAAVVMNYRTGEVLGLVSLEGFDPSNITAATHADPDKPFWNRATQAVYPPGSGFKIITTIAALDSIPHIQERMIPCQGGIIVQDQIIRDYGGGVHGNLSLREAFTVSCNNAYAALALNMKDEALRKTAEAFGFNDNFLFRDLVVENSTYPTTNRTLFEVATSGFGQSAIGATPVHMCMVAAAIANDGVMMEPRLLRGVTTPSGQRRAGFETKVYRTATTAQNAAILQDYMKAVVTSGTGTRAQVSGLTICGKTGSAESSLNGQAVTYGWFIGFIDSDTLPIAVAVMVEDIPDGEGGGSVAAPIAKDIFTYLKTHPDRVTE